MKAKQEVLTAGVDWPARSCRKHKGVRILGKGIDAWLEIRRIGAEDCATHRQGDIGLVVILPNNCE